MPPNLYEKSLISRSKERRLMYSAIDSIATDWPSDGRCAVYMANELGTNWNIWAMPLAGNRTPQAVLRSQFSETEARISQNGRWLAYVSDEPGRLRRSAPRSTQPHFTSPSAGGNVRSVGSVVKTDNSRKLCKLLQIVGNCNAGW